MDMSLLKTYDYFESLQYRYNMVRKYPFLSVSTIGKSVMGREIPAFTIGSGSNTVLFVGGLHGNAHFTSTLLMAFLAELCEKLELDGVIEGLKVSKAFSGRSLTVIPCLNPDSCEIAVHGKSAISNYHSRFSRTVKNDCREYSLNARGADIDLIFASNPLKEPESFALYSFCENNTIRHAIVFGKGEGEIYLPENSPMKSCRMAEIMVSAAGYNLRLGEVCNQLSFTEWFCQKYSRPAFKLSVYTEKEASYPKFYASLRELLMLSAIM